MSYHLLTPPLSNPKTAKNAKHGWWTASLALAPAYEALDNATMCPAATDGCTAACLYHAGRGRFDRTKEARVRRTMHFHRRYRWFMAQLRADLIWHQIVAHQHGMKPACRLNVTSDVAWERMELMQDFPDTQFFDYTKRRDREVPENYHLTFSRSEKNWHVCERVLAAGGTVSAVFLSRLPDSYQGWPVIDGDLHDLRWTDPPGHIVGLRAKGAAAKEDRSGFVIRA